MYLLEMAGLPGSSPCSCNARSQSPPLVPPFLPFQLRPIPQQGVAELSFNARIVRKLVHLVYLVYLVYPVGRNRIFIRNN